MIVPKATVIMVVDGAKLHLYRNDGEADAPELTLIDSKIEHAVRTSEIGSDRPGRRFESAGVSRGAYEGPDYHQQEEDRFAIQAAGQLNGLAGEGCRLILVAAPHVLGIIRKHVDGAARKLLIEEIAGDFAGRPGSDVAAMLVRHQP